MSLGMKRGAPLVALLVTAGMLSACGGGASAQKVGRPSANQNVTLNVRTSAQLGDFLVTQDWTLYMYPPDRRTRVTCTKVEGCSTAWPPLFVGAGHRVIAGPGVKQSLIGTIRGDGGRIVTYNHWPLYYYIGDRKAGQVEGQAQGFNWYVIAPDGIANKADLTSPID
jgi:predicted lipoprotein with Yx(FWY)xxD motif